jgi:hypothetical protein
MMSKITETADFPVYDVAPFSFQFAKNVRQHGETLKRRISSLELKLRSTLPYREAPIVREAQAMALPARLAAALLALTLAISSASAASPMVTFELKCLGWFCETQDLLAVRFDSSTSGSSTVLGSVFLNAAWKLSQQAKVLSTYDPKEKKVYALAFHGPISQGTLFAIDPQEAEKNATFHVPSLYNKHNASSIAFDGSVTGGAILINYGSEIVRFSLAKQKFEVVAHNLWVGSGRKSIFAVSALSPSGTYVVVEDVSQPSDQNSKYAYVSSDIHTGKSTRSPFFQGPPNLGSFAPVWMSWTTQGLLVLFNGDLGCELAVVNPATGNYTKEIMGFQDYAGLGWTLPDPFNGMGAWDAATSTAVAVMTVGNQSPANYFTTTSVPAANTAVSPDSLDGKTYWAVQSVY